MSNSQTLPILSMVNFMLLSCFVNTFVPSLINIATTILKVADVYIAETCKNICMVNYYQVLFNGVRSGTFIIIMYFLMPQYLCVGAGLLEEEGV